MNNQEGCDANCQDWAFRKKIKFENPPIINDCIDLQTWSGRLLENNSETKIPAPKVDETSPKIPASVSGEERLLSKIRCHIGAKLVGKGGYESRAIYSIPFLQCSI